VKPASERPFMPRGTPDKTGVDTRKKRATPDIQRAVAACHREDTSMARSPCSTASMTSVSMGLDVTARCARLEASNACEDRRADPPL
jgi:hypothetical protein